jgi:hypothetical protein
VSTRRSPEGRQTQRLPREDVIRGMGNLVCQLPRLVTNAAGEVDYPGSSPELLVNIADSSQTAVGAIQLGVAAIGNLLAYAAPEVEDGTVSSDTVEALGWLLRELGEFAASLTVLGAHCRRETVDYQPQ